MKQLGQYFFSLAILMLAVGCGKPSASPDSRRLNLLNSVAAPQADVAQHIMCVSKDYSAGLLKKDLPPFFKEGSSIKTGKRDKEGNDVYCPRQNDPFKTVCLTDTFFLGFNSGGPYKKGINDESSAQYEKFCKGQPEVAAYVPPAYLVPSDNQASCQICADLAGACEDPSDRSFSTTPVGNYACIVKFAATQEMVSRN